MKLNIKAVAIAEAVAGGILFILCRLIFTLAPDTTLASSKYLFHTDWSGIALPVTWGGFFLGFVVFTVFMTVVGAAWACLYNYIVGVSAVGSVQPTAISHEKAAA
jgi:hypothetical protein